MIDTLFHLINFGVTIWVAIFVYARYLKPFVLKKLADDSVFRTLLAERLGAATREQRLLQEQLAYQEKLYQTLGDKVAAWKAALLVQQEIAHQDQVRMEAFVQERERGRCAALLEARIAAAARPQACTAARAELERLFADPAVARNSVAALVTALERVQS